VTVLNYELWCVLIGVSCPRAPLANPRAGQSFEPEKYGQEALQFTKELVLQREVEFQNYMYVHVCYYVLVVLG